MTMIRVCRDLDGVDIRVPVHSLVGSRPGPVLAVFAAQHGRHWLSSEIVRHFLASMSPQDMSGSVIAVPIANPVATSSRTRHIRDESDSPDVNRVFGISGNFIANQIATVLTDSVLRKADAQVTVSGGPFWSVKSTAVARDFSEEAVALESFRLAQAFGLPFIRRSDSVSKNPGMTSNFAGEGLGLPTMIVELGGTGFGIERDEQYMRENVEGLRSVCRHLGILDGEPEIPDRTLIFHQHVRLNPKDAGIVSPMVDLEDLMSRVFEIGEPLAEVWDPYSFDLVEEIRAPVRGYIDMVTPSYPVRPGDWTSMMVDLDHPETRWLERDELP